LKKKKDQVRGGHTGIQPWGGGFVSGVKEKKSNQKGGGDGEKHLSKQIVTLGKSARWGKVWEDRWGGGESSHEEAAFLGNEPIARKGGGNPGERAGWEKRIKKKGIQTK